MKFLSKHFVTTVTAAILTCCLAFGLSACGGNEADAVRSATENALGTPTTMNSEKLKGQFGEAGSSVLENFNELDLDTGEFASHMFANYKYNIGDVKVNGNTATADVSITNVDIEKVFQKVFDNITNDQEWIKSILHAASMSNQDEAIAKVTMALVDKFYQTMDNSKDLTTTNVTAHLTKTNNEWTIDANDQEALLAAMLGGTDIKSIKQDLMTMSLDAGTTVAFNTLANLDDETLNILMGSVANAGIQQMQQAGVNVNDLFRHVFARMECQTNSTTFVNENEALVNTTITNVDLGKAMESAQNSLQADPEASGRAASLAAANDENGIVKLFVELIIKKIDETEDKVSSNVQIKFHRDESGNWTIDDTSKEQLAIGMLGGYNAPVAS